MQPIHIGTSSLSLPLERNAYDENLQFGSSIFLTTQLSGSKACGDNNLCIQLCLRSKKYQVNNKDDVYKYPSIIARLFT